MTVAAAEWPLFIPSAVTRLASGLAALGSLISGLGTSVLTLGFLSWFLRILMALNSLTCVCESCTVGRLSSSIVHIL